MAWTHFWDMHSGGSAKIYLKKNGDQVEGGRFREPKDARAICHIFIEATEAEAKVIFYNRFGRNPERVTCTCCGGDYSISESATLAEASGYQRGCASNGNRYVEKPDSGYRGEKYLTVAQYRKSEDVLIVPKRAIKARERAGSAPEEGYVWR